MSDYGFDILFIGAGIMGSASAYALSKELEKKGQNLSIGVIDLDLEGGRLVFQDLDPFIRSVMVTGWVSDWQRFCFVPDPRLSQHWSGLSESLIKELELENFGHTRCERLRHPPPYRVYLHFQSISPS